jgi:hypothetical protein
MKPGNLLTAGEHTMKILKQMTMCLAVLLVTLIAPTDTQAQDRLDHPPGAASIVRQTAEGESPIPTLAPGLFGQHLADYDSELRRPDGRVDIEGMVTRLRELGVTTYYRLIRHAPTDWDDLMLFLPRAGAAGINVWVYLVPPSESPPKYGSQYSEPFRLDYYRWRQLQ